MPTMHRMLLRTARLCALVLLTLTLLGTPPRLAAAAGSTTTTGTLDGTSYAIDWPVHWNGMVVLFSHGYWLPGTRFPHFLDPAGDPVITWLLAQGTAVTGMAFGSGWTVADALRDQGALLDLVTRRFGAPRLTIAMGDSLGGLVTAGLAQQSPTRFAGALSVCGLVGGGVGIWNQGLDLAVAFKALLAPHTSLQLVHISDPTANMRLAQRILAQAQQTASGRARLALASALLDLPSVGPDTHAQLAGQVGWLQGAGVSYLFGSPRADVERRAGGNPSWTTGVDFRAQLVGSVDQREVAALYRQAGLSLDRDLLTLSRAPRIAADPAAVTYLSRYLTPAGPLHVPVLTVHLTGDFQVPVENEQAYAHTARTAGTTGLLRQLFVQRSGHCNFAQPK